MNDEEDTLDDLGEEDGIWFDYTFVEFLKTNYSACRIPLLAREELTLALSSVSVQRAILLDPSSNDAGRELAYGPRVLVMCPN